MGVVVRIEIMAREYRVVWVRGGGSASAMSVDDWTHQTSLLLSDRQLDRGWSEHGGFGFCRHWSDGAVHLLGCEPEASPTV
jgi:hypothetical protein